MFQVIYIATGDVVTVYAINGVCFLVWKNGHWKWIGMHEFRPVTTDDMAEG